jgi:dTMP kinase
MNTIPKGKFIVLEGGEGSGKSTLLHVLAEEYGTNIIVTREPGGSPYAESIRETVLKHPLAHEASGETMLSLMFGARFDHVHKTIGPALEKGISVITDRFDSSSYAYNVHAQSEGRLEELFWTLRKHLTFVPDLYVYLDVDLEEGLRRARSRNSATAEGNHFDDRESSFHQKVTDGYKKFLSHVPHVIVDANRPLADVQRVFLAEIKKHLA